MALQALPWPHGPEWLRLFLWGDGATEGCMRWKDRTRASCCSAGQLLEAVASRGLAEGSPQCSLPSTVVMAVGFPY